MNAYTIIKLVCLVIAIWFWVTVAGKLLRGHAIGGALIGLASIASVAFAYMQGWLA